MRKVIYGLSVTLDGYMEGVNGDLSWSFPDEELHQHFNDRDAQIGLFLYGRGLYENMAAFWPTADEDPQSPEYVREYARIWKQKPKIVFSKTLAQVGWNSRLVRGNIVEEVERLKAQPGQDMIVAGAGIAASFLQLGLIDEIHLYLNPVVLGAGKRMFGPLDRPLPMQLVDTHTFGCGVVLLRYQRAP